MLSVPLATALMESLRERGTSSLAGQPESYLKEQLQKYKSGERQHQIMSIIAGQLSDDEMTTLASWYSKIKIKIVD